MNMILTNLTFIQDTLIILAAFDNEQDSLNFLKSILILNLRLKNKLTIPSLFLIYSFQVSIITMSYFKHITD